MKKNVLNLFLMAALAMGITACKDNRQNTTHPTDALETTDATSTAIPYIVNTSTSEINWKGKKPTGTHTGTIDISEGIIHLKENNEIQSGDFSFDMHSITVTDLKPGEGKEDLEAHLKGTVEGKEGDFFNVNKYPTGKFKITHMTQIDGKTWLQGNLTLKENTRNIQFPVNVSLDGDRLLLESETFTIDRTEWGVNFMSRSIFDDLGDKFIYDDIELTVSVVAERN